MSALRRLWCLFVGHRLPPRAIGGDCVRCGRFTWDYEVRS